MDAGAEGAGGAGGDGGRYDALRLLPARLLEGRRRARAGPAVADGGGAARAAAVLRALRGLILQALERRAPAPPTRASAAPAPPRRTPAARRPPRAARRSTSRSPRRAPG